MYTGKLMNKWFLSVAGALCAAAAVAHTTVENLRVCHLEEPSDIVKPVFSWKMRTDRRGASQKAYAIELRTASGEEVWRSGKVADAASHAVAYTGPRLKSATRYVWSVVVTDERGRETASKPAAFSCRTLRRTFPKRHVAIGVPCRELHVSRSVS